MTDRTLTPAPAHFAREAAEAIRNLNHATFPRAGHLTYPNDVYDVLGALAQVAYAIPQALGQLAAWLDREVDAGRVRNVDTGDPIASAVELGCVLDGAGQCLAEAHELIAAAHSITSPLAAAEGAA